jgi:putative PIN family toxin of toxin-antitoxin system
VRAVLDVNVLVSALISPAGSPARLLAAWQQGAFELIESPLLLAELERALTYPKLRRLVRQDEAAAFVAWLGRSATMAPDPTDPPPARSIDPGDDYLIALAVDRSSFLVSGDAHLLDIAATMPIMSPAAFRTLVDEREEGRADG